MPHLRSVSIVPVIEYGLGDASRGSAGRGSFEGAGGWVRNSENQWFTSRNVHFSARSGEKMLN